MPSNQNNLKLPSGFLEGPIKVILIGLGGTGSEVIDGLIRIHIALLQLGHPFGLDVVAIDGDKVSASNIGRQRYFHSDIGQFKCDVMIHRVNLCYGTSWKSIPKYVTPLMISELIARNTILITCVDNAKVRCDIGKAASRSREVCEDALWLDFGNGKFDGNVFIGHLFNPQHIRRIPNVWDLFKNELAAINDDDEPSCSLEVALLSQSLFVNRACATAGLNLLWDLLTEGSLNIHGIRFDLASASMYPYPIHADLEASFDLVMQ